MSVAEVIVGSAVLLHVVEQDPHGMHQVERSATVVRRAGEVCTVVLAGSGRVVNVPRWTLTARPRAPWVPEGGGV